MIAGSFLFFIAIFLGVGLWASSKHKDTTEDYLLAGRTVGPWLTALSAIASLNSGFIFIGYIGLVYNKGISGALFAIGIYVGYIVLWPWLPRGINKVSHAEKVQTFSGLLGQFGKERYRWVIILASVLTIIFLLIYASAQLTSGSKALSTLFGWPSYIGAILGSIILLFYSFSGGIRASIWTDAVQMCVMLFSMAALFFGALHIIGGVSPLWSELKAIDPNLVSWAPDGINKALLFATGWFFGAFAWAGQPQVMVRFMAMKSSEKLLKTGLIYFAAGISFMVLATFVALEARVLVAELGDPELALPTLALENLHGIFAGLMLAGLFAATMSTADSLVLSCSATLSQNLIPGWARDFNKARLGTLLIILVALTIALFSDESVFSLVLLAFGAMGCAFGPLIMVRALGGVPDEKTAFLMMVTGLVVMFTWRNAGYGVSFTEIGPGILSGFLVFGAGHLLASFKSR